jgi:hypothetical protein
MRHIKAEDIQMGQWTKQIFKAETFDDLMKQVMNFMSSDPGALAAPKEMFTKEKRVAWDKMAESVWNKSPEV